MSGARRRRRVFSEHLAPEVLAAPATLKLLQAYQLEPIVALPPAACTDAMGRALAEVSQALGPLGVWPLLSDADGYWPSVKNFEAFTAQSAQVLSFTRAWNVRVGTVVLDLEPPLEHLRRFFEGGRRERLAYIGRRLMSSVARGKPSAAQLGAWMAEQNAQGLEVLATVFPPVVWDLQLPRAPVSTFLDTPFNDDLALAPMLYSSVLTHMLPGGRGTAERLIQHWGRRLARSRLRPPAACVGLVGTGKLEHEPVLRHPELLLRDRRILEAAGVEDLILFALEGVLADSEPERWLEAFCSTV